MLRSAKRCAIWPGLASPRTISPGLSNARQKRCARCRDDLDGGVAEANAIVSGSLFAARRAGNIAAQIFWLKSRAQWRERAASDNRAADGDAEASSPMVLVLPDNGRDQELAGIREKRFEQKRQC